MHHMAPGTLSQDIYIKSCQYVLILLAYISQCTALGLCLPITVLCLPNSWAEFATCIMQGKGGERSRRVRTITVFVDMHPWEVWGWLTHLLKIPGRSGAGSLFY